MLTDFVRELGAVPPTHLLNHHDRCCEDALAWLEVANASHCRVDRSLIPLWLKGRYRWGPSRWPIYWCEAVASTVLDCGVLADLASVCIAGRGVSVARVQLVQHFPEHVTSQWVSSWQRAGCSPWWIRGDLVYHEVVAVILAGVRLFDPSDWGWLESIERNGYGSVLAMRLDIDPTTSLAKSRLSPFQALADRQWHILDDTVHSSVDQQTSEAPR